MTKLHDFRTNFRFGRVKEGLRVRQDAKAYEASLRDCENLQIMADGSVERRDGTEYIADLAGEARIEPWEYSSGLNMILVFTNAQLLVLDASDHSTLATFTSMPWDATTMWFNKIAKQRNICVIANGDFKPKILSLDVSGNLLMEDFEYSRKISTSTVNAPYVEQIPQSEHQWFRMQGGYAVTATVANALGSNFPELYVDNWVTAIGMVSTTLINQAKSTLGRIQGADTNIIAEWFNPLGGTYGIPPNGSEPSYLSWGNQAAYDFTTIRTPDRVPFKIGDDAYAESYYCGTSRLEFSARTNTIFRLPTNPFFTRKGKATVEVTMPDHPYREGSAVFFCGLSLETTDEMRTILSGACGFETAPTGTAKVYYVDEVIDENTFTITGDANATKTELQGGSDVFTMPAYKESGTSTIPDGSDWLSTKILKFPGFEDPFGWPSTVEFHENRLVFASSAQFPDAVWMSQSGDYRNFDTGNGEANEALGLYGVGNTSRIVNIASEFDLKVFTETSEYFIPGDRGAPLTPETARSVHAGTNNGCSYTDVHSFDGGLFFVDASGGAIREMVPDTSVDQPRYTANNVTGVIEDWVLAPKDSTKFNGSSDDVNSHLIYCSQTDGSAIVLSAARSDDMFGWVKWTLDGDRDFVSMAGVRSTLYAVVRDVATYKLVKFNPSIEELDIRTGVGVGVAMPFFAEISPPRAASGQGSKAGKMLNLVDAEVHWKNTEVGTVEGESILEATDTIVDEWRHYVVGIWDREPVLRIEGTGTGSFGMRAVTLNVYF